MEDAEKQKGEGAETEESQQNTVVASTIDVQVELTVIAQVYNRYYHLFVEGESEKL